MIDRPPPTCEPEGGFVAVLTPSGKDSAVVQATLARAGVSSRRCRDMEALCAALTEGAEAAVIAEEALTQQTSERLFAFLRSLPNWSDPPIAVLAAPGRETASQAVESLTPVANLTIVERPTRPYTLLAVVRAALRARARQHTTRRHMEEIVEAREVISRHRDELVRAVEKRTRELEEAGRALRLSERMAAIGTLSAGVGHDIANLLMPISTHADLLATLDGPAGESAAAIRACVDHLKHLASGLRQLALNPEDPRGVKEGTDLHAWWQEASIVLRNCLPPGVTLEGSMDESLPRAAVAPHQLTQAVFNLVQNAGDVMKPRGHGEVHISADADPGWKGAPCGSGGVRIIVRDNGPGMTEEVKAHCLEPLFTTKVRKISTGLGLALVAGIVRRSCGELRIDSELGVGTAFHLTFPVVRAEDSLAAGEKPLAAVTIRDARWRGIVNASLRSVGYEPLDASTTRPPSEAGVWVVEPSSASADEVEHFVQDGHDRRVLVLGSYGGKNGNPGVVELGERPATATIRQMLQDLRPPAGVPNGHHAT